MGLNGLVATRNPSLNEGWVGCVSAVPDRSPAVMVEHQALCLVAASGWSPARPVASASPCHVAGPDRTLALPIAAVPASPPYGPNAGSGRHDRPSCLQQIASCPQLCPCHRWWRPYRVPHLSSPRIRECPMTPPDRKTLHILIASPLEADQVPRIAGAAPDRAVVIHTPHLLPTPKYVADHNGTKPQLGEAEKARWLELLADADILFDFDWLASVCRKRSHGCAGCRAPSAGSTNSSSARDLPAARS